jgi:hypothetical protein
MSERIERGSSLRSQQPARPLRTLANPYGWLRVVNSQQSWSSPVIPPTSAIGSERVAPASVPFPVPGPGHAGPPIAELSCALRRVPLRVLGADYIIIFLGRRGVWSVTGGGSRSTFSLS